MANSSLIPGLLIPASTQTIFSTLSSSFLEELSTPTGTSPESLRSAVSLVSALSRTSPALLGSILPSLVPLLIAVARAAASSSASGSGAMNTDDDNSDSGADSDADERTPGDDELREVCLQTFETLLLRCPAEIAPFVEDIVAIAGEAVSYDPVSLGSKLMPPQADSLSRTMLGTMTKTRRWTAQRMTRKKLTMTSKYSTSTSIRDRIANYRL